MSMKNGSGVISKSNSGVAGKLGVGDQSDAHSDAISMSGSCWNVASG